MAQVKWLGEGDDGPDEIQAYGRTIKKGESVEIENEAILRKAAGNKSFEVSGGPKDLPKPEETVAEVLPQYPGPNLGEHVRNIGFGNEEELEMHRQGSIQAAERNDEIQEKQGNLNERQNEEKRGPGRPKGSGKGKPERIPPT